jgi:hypothetical protein
MLCGVCRDGVWLYACVEMRVLEVFCCFFLQVGASTLGTSRVRTPSSDLPSPIAGTGHCSSFVKLAPNAADLFVGHATWFTYDTMIRIYKYVIALVIFFTFT